jgi:hypothetical protein
VLQCLFGGRRQREPVVVKVTGPKVLISVDKLAQALAAPAGAGAGLAGAGLGGPLDVTGPLIPIVSTIFKLGQAASAACSIASCWSPDPAVPVSVTVSPLTARPKSGTDAAALKSAVAWEKSSDVISGLMRRLSMMLMFGPKPAFSASSSEAFASGRAGHRKA